MRGDARRWLGTSLAWTLAALHGAAALGKALDLPGFAQVAAAYRLVPAPLLMPGALALTLLEAAVALGLVLRATRRLAALVAAGLALFYGAALTVTLLRGIQLENCGCFGVYLARSLTPLSPLEDLGLAGMAGLAAWLAPARRNAA